jgi:hypothetical protein
MVPNSTNMPPHYGSLTLGNEVAVAKIASAGIDHTRIVTSREKLGRQDALDVWDCEFILGSPGVSKITHKGKIVDNQGSEVLTSKTLGQVGDFNQARAFP